MKTDILKISNHQNAIVAFMISVDALHGAVIYSEGNGKQRLDKRIKVSEHSFIDIVEAMSNVTHTCGFRLVTLLYEQMAYKVNPSCQYPLLDL